MGCIVWLHDEALSARAPVLKAYANSPAVFVFDDDWIAEERISLKRIVFMYECLLELPVEIRKGRVVDEVRAFATEHGADDVVAPATTHPRLVQQGDELGARWHAGRPFVALSEPPDLRRFSRYWRSAKDRVFAPTSTLLEPVGETQPE